MCFKIVVFKKKRGEKKQQMEKKPKNLELF